VLILQLIEFNRIMSKLLTTILSLALALALFTGCDEDDKSTIIDITASASQKIPVVLPDSGTVTFNEQTIIDPIQNDEISRYQSQIQSVKIEKVSFKILNYNGSNDGEFEGTMTFDGLTFELDLPRTFLKETSDNEVVTTLQVSSEELQAITALFAGLDPVAVTVKGTAYNSPMTFDLELAVGIKAAAEIVP